MSKENILSEETDDKQNKQDKPSEPPPPPPLETIVVYFAGTRKTLDVFKVVYNRCDDLLGGQPSVAFEDHDKTLLRVTQKDIEGIQYI